MVSALGSWTTGMNVYFLGTGTKTINSGGKTFGPVFFAGTGTWSNLAAWTTGVMTVSQAATLNFTNKFIYYVGPVDPVRDEVVGPAGPTTATRMDKFTETMLAKTGLLGMIGKAERGQEAIDAIKKHQAVYLMAVGGAAYLASKAIRKARIIAFEDLGMEAIHEFVVEDMPVTVAVDSAGVSIHQSAPKLWQSIIGKIPVIQTT